MSKEYVMKHLLVSILVWITAFGVVAVEAAYGAAQPSWGPALYLADTPSGTDWIKELETELLPQIETIFNSDQREQFQASLAEGLSFRKAFKSLMLTAEQKTQLKTVLNSVSKKDALASLTPEQKKQLFLKKKEMFRPTAAEVTEKIEASLKEKGVELPAGVKDKIDAGLKMKDSFMPTAETVMETIEAGMSAVTQPLESK